MKIELTEKEIKILYNLIMRVSWQGDSLETAVSLKRKLENKLSAEPQEPQKKKEVENK